MCGIVGIWAREYDRDQLRLDISQAAMSLHHRGPDDRGIWMNGSGLALGHTRLSILDLSPLGHQPMVSSDGRYVVVFNGEIYNFREIRKRLASMGHSFSGSGDTEVILHAFREWGHEAVRQFIGMFAIALWDEQGQQLDLFRDRVGIKPLYVGWDRKVLCFASELKALLAFRHWTPRLNRQSLGEFLQFGYVPDDRSIYEDVFKLKPGHRLSIQAGKPPIVQPYWSVLDAVELPLHGSDEEVEEELETLLIDAFRYRMVSDVPVGIFLSGGIDSTLVTSILAKHHAQPIRTFTIGFDEGTLDESRWARKVANHCGTIHTEYILKPVEALEIARNWGSLFDEPFGDSSSIPTLLVSRLASQEVKVVLSADGGDELFSGYNAYATVLSRLDRLSRLPQWLQNALRHGLNLDPMRGIFAHLPRAGRLTSKCEAIIRKRERFKAILSDTTPYGQIENAMSHWLPTEINELLGDYVIQKPLSIAYPGDPATQIGLRDFHHYLPGDILTKVDRTTMAVSIEGREPLLDHRLAEFAFRLPPHLRRGSLGPKHILKSILYRHVPRELIDRPKQGFAIPKKRWLTDELKELVLDLLSPGTIQSAGVMDWKSVNRVVKNFYAGDTTLVEPLWYLMTFEMWRTQWGSASKP